MLHRDSRPARTCKIAGDFHIFDHWIRSAKNFYSAPIGVKKFTLLQFRVLKVGLNADRFFRLGKKPVGTGDAEATQHCPAADAIPKVYDMIDHCGISGFGFVRDFRMSRR